MASNFAKRLDRLERLARELVHQTVAHRFLDFDEDFTADDYLRRQEEVLDEMVSNGDILESQRGRVKFIRWMTKDEDVATRKKAAEDAAWTAVSEEAATVAPPVEEVAPRAGDSDLEDELRRKFTRPIDEIITLPSGIV